MASIQELDQIGNYNYTLDPPPFHTAIVTALFESSTIQRTVPFAGHSYTYPANSLKLTVYINGWQFKSNLNTLRAVFATQFGNDRHAVPTPTPCSGGASHSGDNTDPSFIGLDGDNLQFVKLIKDNVTFFGRFLPYVMANDRAATSRNELINQTNLDAFIGINMPQCDKCLIDPDFSVLINPKNGDGSDSADCNHSPPSSNQFAKWKIATIAVILGVVALAVVVGAAIFIKHRAKSNAQRATMSMRIQELSKDQL
ncbi:hypothetical protein SAMD00019534_107000 [Acytostelium subglobosum LB1]|uniref:hypothetical protein n=1 Tax=Acytostelium subglobosum LB1 TaxID=1410327 RepID=UPI000644AD25|nr:hypothetical protein SAMD00019534_107000 [Acytostelium subglobosum LB1]GAM27524.1 hypothetical protein SAMD00019534_107000 [Acytostelium subglobosum LB1]|eukprot:XP_012749589.1 hypothetical protein SAMD00019534_107000 [Acytostelium subglobosum LB1]